MKKSTTPTFLLELPLAVDPGQARRQQAHFEAARCLYNALLGEALSRLHRMRADPAWQAARAMPKARKQERAAAFSQLRQDYGFSEYALHDFAKKANCTWIADHIDAMLAQTLASRAYQAVNRVCLGKAKKVRFKSKGRGLDSVENKWEKSGLRFVLQPPEEGNHGWLVWGKDRLPAIIDWNDPVVKHGLDHRIKYARLIRRKASSPRAEGADSQGYRYYVQLALAGTPYQKKKHTPGREVIGLDLGLSTVAIVPREREARLVPLCEELAPNTRKKRRLERKLDRQRRANNPQHYDEKGRIKKHGKRRLTWKHSKGYLVTRRRLAHQERKLAAHRKSLHGRLVHEIIRVGNDIRIEKIAYKGWQKRYGKSVGLRAPGMFIDHLRRTVANTGGILHEFPTRTTKLSQYCHGCRTSVKKPLAQRWHQCACGVGPVQRDLYSAFLAAYLDPPDYLPSSARYSVYWEGADLRLRAALGVLAQRANEGRVLPRSVGITGAGARLPKSLVSNRQGLLYRRGRLAALELKQEPPVLWPGECQIKDSTEKKGKASTSMSENFPCWYPVQIRFRDLDPLAHVNNTVYFTYFEEARSYYFSHLETWLKEWPSREEHQEVESIVSHPPHNPRIQTRPDGSHYGILIKEVTCTYMLPLVRSDIVEVGVRVARVGHTSFLMDHQIRDMNEHERIFATGKSALVWCDYYTGRPHPVPPSLRHAFEQMEGREFPAPGS